MKLVLRRDQRGGLLGKQIFSLDVRAELTDEERASIRKYKLGPTILYERKGLAQGSNEYAQLGHTLAWRFLNLIITVDDLESGKRVECKDIVEMIAVEGQIPAPGPVMDPATAAALSSPHFQ